MTQAIDVVLTLSIMLLCFIFNLRYNHPSRCESQLGNVCLEILPLKPLQWRRRDFVVYNFGTAKAIV